MNDYVGFKLKAVLPGDDNPILNDWYYDEDPHAFFSAHGIYNRHDTLFSGMWVTHEHDSYTHDSDNAMVYELTLLYDYEDYIL